MTDQARSIGQTPSEIIGLADDETILGGAGGDEIAGVDADSVGGGEDAEIVDGLPVLAEVHPLPAPALHPLSVPALHPLPAPAPAPVALPAVQAAAAAATGFVAGAATLALCRRVGARRRARVVHSRALDGLAIIGTRSFLVDVHLIAKPDE